jgi:hypothetical protein
VLPTIAELRAEFAEAERAADQEQRGHSPRVTGS